MGVEDPDWFADVRRNNKRLIDKLERSGERAFTITLSKFVTPVTFSPLNERKHGLNLQDVPNGWTVTLFMKDEAHLTIFALAEGAALSIQSNARRSREREYVDTGIFTLQLPGSFQSRISVDVGDSEYSVKIDHPEVLPHVSLISGSVQFAGNGAITTMSVKQGKVEAARVHELTLRGETQDDLISLQKVWADTVMVDGEATLDVDSLKGGELKHFYGSAGRGKLFLARRDGKSRDPVLAVRSIQNLSISTDEQDVFIAVSSHAIGVDLTGPIVLVLHERTNSQDIRFNENNESAPKSPLLQGGKDSVVLDASGYVRISCAQQMTLEANGQGLRIIDIAPRKTRSGTPSHPPEEACLGATLRGFTVSPTLDGLATLNLLSSAATLSPHPSDLPGSELSWLGNPFRGADEDAAAWRVRGERPDDNPLTRLNQQTLIMRRLRELSREKGASGAVRSRVGWCAQRLRHRTTTGFIERAALCGYRMMGYGERPMPAFTTWLALTVVLSLVATYQDHAGSWEMGFWGPLLLMFFDFASGPIGSLGGTGAAVLSDSWQYLTRAVVAVPLVVGALSLRNYVRS